MSSVSAIVLAAGFARRMQQKQKLLLPLQQKPILAWVLESLAALPLGETIVVVQSTAPFRHLLTSFPVHWVENPEAESGLARSIQYGIRTASDAATGYLFVLGDMPKVQPRTYATLLHQHDRFPDRILVPRYHGQRGNPVLFPTRFRDALLQLSGDQGARPLLQRYADQVRWLDLDDPGILIDVDTEADYQHLLQQS